MSKEIVLADKASCTGCAACHDACGQNAIAMTCGDSLHEYPQIDAQKCVQCGRCMSVCPALNAATDEPKEQRYYYAWSQSALSDYENPTSGGVGVALMQYAMEHDYYVCAPLFDADWHLAHKLSNDVNDLKLMTGSKYLQSEMTGHYKEIIAKLREGGKVLFMGTPCQVEGVKRIVPQKFQEQLVTCGIICHGVNSARAWEDFVADLQAQNKSKLTTYNFRSKRDGWGKMRISYAFESGKKKDVPHWKNQFHTWFGLHLVMRRSCFKCAYRKEKRNSDITIGDFWGIQKIKPELDTKKGVTALVVSTEKGARFVGEAGISTQVEVDNQKSPKVLQGYIDKGNSKKREMEIARAAEFEHQYLATSYKEMTRRYPAQSVLGYYLKAIKSRLK